MRYIEIVPRNGSHYLLTHGVEISRHNSGETAEAVRLEFIRQELVERVESAATSTDPNNARVQRF
jgi:hypothetical protein